jgi:hypothetical protein
VDGSPNSLGMKLAMVVKHHFALGISRQSHVARGLLGPKCHIYWITAFFSTFKIFCPFYIDLSTGDSRIPWQVGSRTL